MASRGRLHRLPQDKETLVQTVRCSSFAYRFAYSRAAETRAVDDSGQDYLVVWEGDKTFIFALCDGVSQSFYGDLAARHLGDALVTWLGRHLPPTMNPEAIRAALTVYLRDLTGPVTERVQRHSLPPDIPPLLRDVLEEKRALGSESTFVCGRIDLPGDDFPAGRLVLAWMGDSRMRLWGEEHERTADLGGVFETAQRWSSRRGPVGGEPNIYVVPLEQEKLRISRLMAYSDGLAALDTWDRGPSNYAVQDLVTRANEAATSDDISFLEVWLGPVPAHIEAAPLPAPRLLEVGLREGRIRAAWRPVAGARSYEVEIRDGGVQSRWAKGTDWESPVVPPGEHRLRVRAWRDEEPGEWSEEQWVAVPEPSAVAPPPVEPVSPPPIKVALPGRRIWLRWGCVGPALACLVLGVILIGLTLPADGPLHGLILGPGPTNTPRATATPTETAITTGTPTSTWTPPPTETPADVWPSVATLTRPLTAPPSDVWSPIATPTLSPTATMTATWTPTATMTATWTPSVTLTPSPMAEEPAPTGTSTP